MTCMHPFYYVWYSYKLTVYVMTPLLHHPYSTSIHYSYPLRPIAKGDTVPRSKGSSWPFDRNLTSLMLPEGDFMNLQVCLYVYMQCSLVYAL